MGCVGNSMTHHRSRTFEAKPVMAEAPGVVWVHVPLKVENARRDMKAAQVGALAHLTRASDGVSRPRPAFDNDRGANGRVFDNRTTIAIQSIRVDAGKGGHRITGELKSARASRLSS